MIIMRLSDLMTCLKDHQQGGEHLRDAESTRAEESSRDEVLNPELNPELNPKLLGITHDSRAVKSGWLYVVLSGRHTHGARYIPQAIERGAVAIALPADEPIPSELPSTFPRLMLTDPRVDMAYLSEWIWGSPLQSIELIGLTGTNGKTTTSMLLAEMISMDEGDVGLLGTVCTQGGGVKRSSSLTTLESTDLHHHFASLVAAGVKKCVMEVSSIGISEHRVAATHFSRAAFLNLSEDHLDYHQDMKRYGEAKLKLFSQYLKDDALVVVNLDDPFGVRAYIEAKESGAEVWGLRLFPPHNSQEILRAQDPQDLFESQDPPPHQVYWSTLHQTPQGISGVLQTPRGVLSLSSPLLGQFNAYNLATAAALAHSLGISAEAIQAA